MNPKVLVAFAGGAMAASGVVFLAMRPGPHSAAAENASGGQPVYVATLPQPAPAALPDVKSAQDLVRIDGHTAAVSPDRTLKPSAMPAEDKKWPARKPEPVVARISAPEASMPVKRTTEPALPAAEIQPAAPAQPPALVPASVSSPPPAEQQRTPNTVTLRPGILITVRTAQLLSAQRNQVGDSFYASLDAPLVIDGWIIAARGSRAEGRVVTSNAAGRVEGGSQLGLQLVAINTTDGQHIGINTATFLKREASWSGRDAASVGGAAALGAVIGAAAGGGKGAGIGAAVGGAAVAGGVIYSRHQGTDIPVETRISFRVDQPVNITERLD